MFDSHQQVVIPSDPQYASSVMPLNLEGLADLWEHTLGDPGITIAILDGPCDTTHPSLAQASLTQMDFVGSGTADGPAVEHGTHTASIIFGQHDSPVKGIAPQCRGLVIPIFQNAPQGGITPCSQPDLARAIRAAANAGANVINVSGGQFSFTGTAHPMLTKAVQECHEQGRLIVAAAGNDGCPCLHVPGALPSVLTVGAMDADGNPTEFSNWGSQYQTSGLLAPGVGILGALPGNRLGMRTGTSYSAPIVSGLAGLLLSLQKAQGLGPNAQEVRAALLETALGCEHREVPNCSQLLTGRLNVSGAVSKIISLSNNNGGNIMSESEGNIDSESSNVPDQSTAEQPIALAAQSTQGSTAASVATSASKDQDTKADSSGDLASLGANFTGAGEVVAAGHETPTRRAGFPSGAMASDCGCQKNGELVYAIGGLTIDFGTQARMDSIKQAFENFNFSSRKLNVHDNADVLRHLFGWREWKPDPGKKEYPDPGKEEPFYQHRGHLYDAKDLTWVVTQDESPLYAIQPMGSYSEEAYFELAHFLLETEGFDDDHEPQEKDSNPLNMFFHPSLDTDDTKVKGPNPNRTLSKKGKVLPIIDRVAIPGRIGGMVRLMNGMEVPVICPNQRGTRSWRLQALVDAYTSFDPDDKSAQGIENEKKMRWLERLVRRFMEEARNPGLSGEDRAKNFATTHSFKIANDYQRLFGSPDLEPDVDSISVEPSPTCRKDSECYDVTVAFFYADNVLKAKDVQRYTVDVSDEVPVLLGEPQLYKSR